MTILANKRLYLSSPIEYCKDASWRPWVKEVLANEFKLRVLDPNDDPKQKEAVKLPPLKEQGNYGEVRRIVKNFVRMDLSIVDRADIFIAYVPHKVPTTGCVHEIVNSNNAKKPTLLVEGQSKNRLASWYFGFIPDHFMFGKWEELFDFLRDVNAGKYEQDNRWWFLYHYPSAWLD